MRLLKFLLTLLFAISFLFFTNTINAASGDPPVPPATPIPCTEVTDSEFHSLRPYPGSPCLAAMSETASFCGDSLTLTDNIKITYNPDTDNCVSIPGGKVRCTYSKNQNKKIKIDLSEAELPIMGNTEDVFNSQNPITSDNEENKKRNIPPEERVNNYVSWYLNGIFNRAEYSPIALADPNASPAPPSIVDFSGPINKLLPQEVAFRSKINTVKQAGKTRHNQIVGCTYSVTAFFGLIHIGRIPGPCYIDSIALDILKIIFKIDDEKWRLKKWGNKLPPLRSDFDNYTDYYVKYQEWRGKKCWQIEIPESILGVKIPILGGLTIVVCGDDPTNPNFYGTMFSYIPLTSTEDRKGEVTASGSVGSAPGVTISNVSTSFTNSILYFAHMQEASEAAAILQDTFVYKGADKFAAGNSVPVNTAGSCKIVDVRSNPGDNLLATPITGNISYTAAFTCDFNAVSSSSCSGTCVPSQLECRDGGGKPGTGSCSGNRYCCNFSTPTPPPPQTCTEAIPITIATTTKTPLADKIWAQLVSGTSSVFRRIFPKLGSGSQIGEVKDIPASTKVTYSGDVSGTGDLNFPHIGGVSEYFLKGIQTMLRPKGYGESISFGETPPGVFASGSCPLVGENVYLLCSSFNGPNSSGCHGSNLYWQSNGLCTEDWCQNYPGQTCCVNHYACRWQIPVLEGQQCYTNTYPDSVCYDPASTCKPEAYGLAADFAYSGNLCGADAPVVLPEINGQKLNWELVTSFEFGCGGCAGGILKANDGTNAYEIHMYHLNQGIASGGVSGQQVGTLYCFPAAVGHPHVHIELRINGEMVKPDNLCQ